MLSHPLAVTQRYIGAQKTRSKCRRYSTVRTQYLSPGCFLAWPENQSDIVDSSSYQKCLPDNHGIYRKSVERVGFIDYVPISTDYLLHSDLLE